jgi:hypothetical protein
LNVTDRANLHVSRTVRLALPVATESAARMRAGSDPVRAIGLSTGGRVQMELPFRRDEWHPLGRPDLAPARTYGAIYSRSNRRFCDVEVELSPWSGTVSELSVSPTVRSAYRWSGRKLDRWFTAAHAAADSLSAQLLAQSLAHELVDFEDEVVAV